MGVWHGWIMFIEPGSAVMALPLSHQAGHLICQLLTRSHWHWFWLLKAVNSGVDGSQAWLHNEIIRVLTKNTDSWAPPLSMVIQYFWVISNLYFKDDLASLKMIPMQCIWTRFWVPQSYREPLMACWPLPCLSQNLHQCLGYGLNSQA